MCKKCNKPGWAGCGAHVEQVLGDVADRDRCHCNDRPTRNSDRSGKRSLVDRLLNR
jgi:hypothetical protein